MRRRNLITSVIRAVEKKTNRTVVVGFVGILQISHKFWRIPEIAVRLQKIRNGAKSRFLYRLLKTNNTPIELLWFKFGVLFILEVTAGFEPADNGVADRGLTAWLRHHMIGGEGDPFRFLKKNGYELFVPVLERITGLEPATSTLARSRSTK